MSEETAPVAVAPAAEPTPQATPPVAPTPTPTPAPQEKLSKKLFDLLTAPGEDPTEQKPKVEKKTETPPAAKEPAPKEPAAPSAEKPIKVRKAKAAEETPPPVPKKSDLHKDVPAAPAAPASAPAKPAVDDDANFENDLVDEEKALLDDARAAEKYLGDKYKGHGGKMTSFLRENVKKSEALEKGEIDQAEYDDWYKANLPKISALDFRKLERERVKEDVAKEFEPKIDAERHARWVESEAPKIKAKGDGIRQQLLNTSFPDEVQRAFAERTKGITDNAEFRKVSEAVFKEYALETEITQNIVNAATGVTEALYRVSTENPATGKKLAEIHPQALLWVPDATRPDGGTWQANPDALSGDPRVPVEAQQQAAAFKMVQDVCAEFKANGGAALKKDGKWFVTRQEWSDMAPQQRAPFWTFDNDQIVNRALGNVKNAVVSAVAAERDRLEKRYGFKRTIAQAAAPVQAAPQQTHGAPPAPRPSPVPPPPGTAAPSTGSILAAKLTTNPTEG